MTGQLHKMTDPLAWMTVGHTGLALHMPGFCATLKGLSEDDQRLLIRGMMAACMLPSEYSREQADLRECIKRLSDELKEKTAG